jgi:hypothetical protein
LRNHLQPDCIYILSFKNFLAMKTKMILFIAILAILATSCQKDDDSYSLGKYWVGFGMVEKTGPENFTIQLDNGTVLYPVAGQILGSWYENAGRVLVNFTILSDKKVTDDEKEYYVKINSVRKILKKGIIDITPAIEDSIGNDPIIIRDAWVSSNQLLNFELRYFGNYATHFINLVKQPGELSAGDQPIELELRHNKNGDREDYPFTAYVTFDMSAIKIAGLDSVRYIVRSTNYDGIEKTFEGSYKYSNN